MGGKSMKKPYNILSTIGLYLSRQATTKHYLIKIDGTDGGLGILIDGTIECGSKAAAISAAQTLCELLLPKGGAAA